MRVLIIGLLGIFCMSCSKPNIEKDVEGSWQLINVICFCAFDINEDFSVTKIEFNTKDKVMTVIQNGEKTYFKNAGRYPYEVADGIFTFSDNTSYKIRMESNSVLELVYQDNPAIADDEVNYIFDAN